MKIQAHNGQNMSGILLKNTHLTVRCARLWEHLTHMQKKLAPTHLMNHPILFPAISDENDDLSSALILLDIHFIMSLTHLFCWKNAASDKNAD